MLINWLIFKSNQLNRISIVREIILTCSEQNSMDSNHEIVVVIRSQPDFAEGFNSMLELLTNLASTSSAMQDLISAILIRPIQTIEFETSSESSLEIYRKSREQLEQVHQLMNMNISQELRDAIGGPDKLWSDDKKSLLDEFAFWQGNNFGKSVSKLFSVFLKLIKAVFTIQKI